MSDEEKENSVVTQIFKDGYKNIFEEQWSVMTAGLLLAIVSIFTFMIARPWGVVGGLRNWADWFFYAIGLYDKSPTSAVFSTGSVITFGLLWGAFGSALMAKQFKIQMAPRLELIKGVVGGILLGVGSALAGGCNLGGFYQATGALSLSGVLMLVGLLIGANIGIRYLYWEMENLTTGSVSSSAGGFDWKPFQPYIGALAFIAAIVVTYFYSLNAFTTTGLLLLCGVAIGAIFQRSRLCFVAGFRDPFMTGETDKTKAIIVSLIVSLLGYAALKWGGIRGEMVYVTNTFWFGSIVGGFIFGFGMLLAGGCGSGCAFRAGEGQIKLIVALVFFAGANSLVKAFMKISPKFTEFVGGKFFLPDYLPWSVSVLVIIAVLLVWYLFVTWNEETEKFVIEM
jgi:uncharacterized protein